MTTSGPTPSDLDRFSPDYDPEAAYEASEDADYDRAVDADGPPFDPWEDA